MFKRKQIRPSLKFVPLLKGFVHQAGVAVSDWGQGQGGSWKDTIREKGPQYMRQFSEVTTLHGVRYLAERNRSLLERKSRLDVIQDLCGAIDVGADFLEDEAIKYVLKNCLPDIERVFVSIVRMNQPLEPLADHIQLVMTPVSVCYTHNMLPLQALLRPEFLNVYEENGLSGEAAHATAHWSPDQGYSTRDPSATPLRLWGNGLRTSTKYLMSIADDDYDEACSFGTKAISVYLHSPAEIPWRVHSNVFIDMDYRVMVFITPTVTITDDSVKVWDPIKRGCYFETERYLRFFKIYNQRNCERECDANNTLAACGCVLMAHPRNTTMTICGPKKYSCAEQSQQEMIEREMRENTMSGQCLCLPSCNEVDFIAEPHSRPWRFIANSTFPTVTPRVQINATSIALMGVAVKKKYFNKTRRTALMGYAAYVASVGGILSLFLGISFLSLFEIVYFLTLRAVTNFWNMKKNKKQGMFWVQPTGHHMKNRPFIL